MLLSTACARQQRTATSISTLIYNLISIQILDRVRVSGAGRNMGVTAAGAARARITLLTLAAAAALLAAPIKALSAEQLNALRDLAATAADDVVVTPPRTTDAGAPALLVLMPGALVEPSRYRPLADAAQAAASDRGVRLFVVAAGINSTALLDIIGGGTAGGRPGADFASAAAAGGFQQAIYSRALRRAVAEGFPCQDASGGDAGGGGGDPSGGGAGGSACAPVFVLLHSASGPTFFPALDGLRPPAAGVAYYASVPLPAPPGGRRAASFSEWAGSRPTMFLSGSRDGQLRLFGIAPYAAAAAAAADSDLGPAYSAARWPFILIAGANHAQSSGGGALRRERGDISAGVPFEGAIASSGDALAAFIAAHAGRAETAAGARAELLQAVAATARFVAPYARAAGYGDVAAPYERRVAVPGCKLGRSFDLASSSGLSSGVVAAVQRACEEAQRMELRGLENVSLSIFCIVHEADSTFNGAEAQVVDDGGTGIRSGADPGGAALPVPAPSADDADRRRDGNFDVGGGASVPEPETAGGASAPASAAGGGAWLASNLPATEADGWPQRSPRLVAVAHALVRYRNGSNINPTAPDLTVKLLSCGGADAALGRSGSCAGGGLGGWTASVVQRARAALAAAQVGVGGVPLVEEAPGEEWERRAVPAATAADVARVRAVRTFGGVALRGQLLDMGASVIASLPTEAQALEWQMLDAYRGEPWAG